MFLDLVQMPIFFVFRVAYGDSIVHDGTMVCCHSICTMQTELEQIRRRCSNNCPVRVHIVWVLLQVFLVVVPIAVSRLVQIIVRLFLSLLMLRVALAIFR